MLPHASVCKPPHLCAHWLSRPVQTACATLSSVCPDTFHLGPKGRAWAHLGAATALGTGIACMAGFAALHTVLPSLLSISNNAPRALDVFRAMPMVGELLQFTVARGGVFGAVTTSACWLGVINTLMLGEGRADTLSYWALAHAAMGVAIAPLWLPGVMFGAPVLSTVATAALLTSYTLSGRLLSGKSTWQGAIVGALGALALGPLGAQVAAGVAQPTVLASALALGAAGGTLMGAYLLSYGWRILRTDETALLHRFWVPTANALRLDMLGESEPGVFGVPEGIVAEVKSCRLNLNADIKLGLRCFLLSGTPGTGKTLLAQGIAQMIGADMFAPRTASIKVQHNPAAFVMELFEEARIKARKTQRPVVLFFDEAERLFENRAVLQHGGATDRTSHDLVLAFNEELDGVHRHADLNLVVIAATNFEQDIDQSIRSRFLVRETLKTPLASTVEKIFATQLQHLQRTEAVSRFVTLRFEPEALARWAARIESHALAGRDIKAIVTAALRQLSAFWVDTHGADAPGASRNLSAAAKDFPSAMLLEQAVEHKLNAFIAAMHDAPQQAAPQPYAPAAPQGRQA